jgi:hypothetical protein
MAYDHILQSKHGSTYYARLTGRNSGLVWDDTNGQVAANPDYADQVIDLVEPSGDGDFAFVCPTDLPVGRYKLSYRLQAGVSPANTDSVVASVSLDKTPTGRVIVST